MLYFAAVADKKVNAITKTQWRMQCTATTTATLKQVQSKANDLLEESKNN